MLDGIIGLGAELTDPALDIHGEAPAGLGAIIGEVDERPTGLGAMNGFELAGTAGLGIDQEVEAVAGTAVFFGDPRENGAIPDALGLLPLGMTGLVRGEAACCTGE